MNQTLWDLNIEKFLIFLIAVTLMVMNIIFRLKMTKFEFSGLLSLLCVWNLSHTKMNDETSNQSYIYNNKHNVNVLLQF
jgi:hypothetical protein